MKCSSCGKNFDYEKYYGICPKCGTYNKKENPQEAHDKLHETEDHGYQHTSTGQDPWSTSNVYEADWKRQEQQYAQEQADARYEQGFNGGAYDEGMRTPLTPEEMTMINNRKKAGGILLLIAVIFIVVSIVIIVIGANVASMGIDPTTEVDALEEPVTPTLCSLGEDFVVDEDWNISVNVAKAEVLCNAGEEADFPEGEKLVSVLIKGKGSDQDWNYDDNLFDPVGNIYVGYQGIYEGSISDYEMDDYPNYKEGRMGFSSSTLRYDDQTGYLYFFIPQDVMEFSLYVEQRDVDTNQVIAIYEVPISLGADQGTDADDSTLQNDTTYVDGNSGIVTL